MAFNSNDVPIDGNGRSAGNSPPQTEGSATRNAWRTSLAAMLALIPSSASVGLYAQGYFLEPMTNEFGWSRADFMSAISISIIGMAICSPLIGYWGDRYGVRRVLMAGVFCYGAGTIALALLGQSLLVYTLATITVGVCAIVQSPILYAKAIAGWAPQNIRGITLSVAVTGIPIGNFLIPIITAWLVSEYGWRAGRVGIGLSLLLLSLPMIYFFIREPVQSAAPILGKRPQRGILSGLCEIAKEPITWLLVVILAAGGLAFNGLLAHFIPLSGDRGLSIEQATIGLTAMAIAGGFGRLTSGWVLDRIQHPTIGLLWFGLGILGVALIGLIEGQAALFAGVALIGLAVGAEVELAIYYTSRYFRFARFGETYGLLASSYSIGTAIGSFAFGLSFDLFGSYDAALLASAVLLVIACLCIVRLPAYPAEADKRLQP